MGCDVTRLCPTCTHTHARTRTRTRTRTHAHAHTHTHRRLLGTKWKVTHADRKTPTTTRTGGTGRWRHPRLGGALRVVFRQLQIHSFYHYTSSFRPFSSTRIQSYSHTIPSFLPWFGYHSNTPHPSHAYESVFPTTTGQYCAQKPLKHSRRCPGRS